MSLFDFIHQIFSTDVEAKETDEIEFKAEGQELHTDNDEEYSIIKNGKVEDIGSTDECHQEIVL